MKFHQAGKLIIIVSLITIAATGRQQETAQAREFFSDMLSE